MNSIKHSTAPKAKFHIELTETVWAMKLTLSQDGAEVASVGGNTIPAGWLKMTGGQHTFTRRCP